MADNYFDLVLVSEDPKLIARVTEICTEFAYTFTTFKDIEGFIENPPNCRLGMFTIKEEKDKAKIASEAAEGAQAFKQMAPLAFIVAIVGKGLSKDAAEFLRKSGANLVLMGDEATNTSKFEFLFTQVIKAQYIPFKAADLTANAPIDFTIYHFMPQRQKFLKFAFPGDELQGDKLKKLLDIGEFYIHRTESEKLKDYILKYSDNTYAGLAKRCRSQFLALYVGYSDLVFSLTDQSQQLSFEDGKKLLSKCQELAKNLVNSLADFGEAWDIVNNSTIGEFGSLERSPAIAAYAALFALKMGMPKMDDVMLASLVSDLGLILLPPTLTKKIRHDKMAEFTEEETKLYRNYPNTSIEVVLSRKLPVEQGIRDLVLKVNERADGKGFPKGVKSDKLTKESQLIAFCAHFDKMTLLKIGQARVDRAVVRKQIIVDELDKMDRFSAAFLVDLKKCIDESTTNQK